MGTDDKERAAAICENCGEIRAVRVWPDGSVRAIGDTTGEDCTCGDPALQVMSSNLEVPPSESTD